MAKKSFIEQIQDDFKNMPKDIDTYTFSDTEIQKLQDAEADQLERETIKLLLQIYERSMNTAEMLINLIKNGDSNGKTKEAVSHCYGEANRAMTNMISLIKSKKSLDMNRIDEDSDIIKDNDKLKIGAEEFRLALEGYDAKEE